MQCFLSVSALEFSFLNLLGHKCVSHMQGARVILEIPIVADVALSSIERSLLCISVSNKLMVFGFDN